MQSFANVLDSFLHKKSGSAGVIEFLDAMELKDILEDKDDPDKPEIQLMTFHASKGLEFPVCILAGIEEEILPHRTLGSDIDEERRLFYVAVTRAKEKLILTRALQRRRFGRMQNSQASRFLIELPENLFRTYYSGFRPLTEDDRLSMLQALLNK